MKICISILIAKLQEIYDFTYNGISSNILNLERPIYYDCTEKLLDNHIYLCVNTFPNQKIPHSSIVFYIGQPLLSENIPDNVIILDESISHFKLFNDIQKIFNIYDSWSNQLQDIVNEEGNIQDMIDCSFEIFNNPILIHTSDFSTVAICENEESNFKLYELCNDQVLFECINSFKLDEEYNNARYNNKPFIFPDHLSGIRSLCSNICFYDKYSHRVVISEERETFQDYHLSLLEYLSYHIGLMISKHNYLQLNNSPLLSDLIAKVVSNEISDLCIIENSFSRFEWLPEHEYIMVNVETSKLDILNLTVNSICIRLESLIKGCCAFPYNDAIIIFINLSKSNDSIEEISNSLVCFLRDCYLKAGISNSFTGFSEIRYHYIQSNIALNTGIRSYDYVWIHRFEHIAPTYLLDCCTDTLPTHLVCSKKLLILKNYDTINQTEYYITLKTYLQNNQNAVKSAKDLFIHRTTLIYRLDKIKSLTNINFDDYFDLLYIQLSYSLLDRA